MFRSVMILILMETSIGILILGDDDAKHPFGHERVVVEMVWCDLSFHLPRTRGAMVGLVLGLRALSRALDQGTIAVRTT